MAASVNVSDEILIKLKIEKLMPFQELTLFHILNGESVMVCKKTGCGKSMCYQAFQPCWTEKHGGNCQVLVVCPLISIMKEQCDFLSAAGFTATYIGMDHGEDDAILKGDFQFIFTSPESILGEYFIADYSLYIVIECPCQTTNSSN